MRELQLQDWGIIIGVVVLLLGVSGVFVGLTAPTDHARVTVTSTGESSTVDSPLVVPYAELEESSQAVFRKAVRQEGFVDEPMSDVTELQGVTAVSLDGETYAVRMDTGERPLSFGAIAFGGVVFSIIGFIVIQNLLNRIDAAAHDVFVGVSGVVLAVGLIVSGVYLFAPPVSDEGVSMSTTPVPTSSVSDGNVVSASVLTPGEREAVYDVVGGGAAVPATEASYVRMEELRSISGEFEYVKTNSEYYALRTVSGYEWPGEIFKFALFVGVGVFGGGKAARLAWESPYIAGERDSTV